MKNDILVYLSAIIGVILFLVGINLTGNEKEQAKKWSKPSIIAGLLLMIASVFLAKNLK